MAEFSFEDAPSFSGVSGAAPALGDFFDESPNSVVTQTPYAKLLCEIEDVKRGHGQKLHALLREFNPTEWMAVRSYLSGFARPEVKPDLNWEYVTPANRGRNAVVNRSYEWATVTIAQLHKILPMYPSIEYSREGILYNGKPISVNSVAIDNPDFPVLSGGFATHATDAREFASRAYATDWLQNKPVVSVSGTFSNGVPLIVSSAFIEKVMVALNNNTPPHDLLDQLAATATNKGILDKIVKGLSHVDFTNGLIQLDPNGAAWKAPNAETWKQSMTQAIVRFIPFLEECRKYRKTDNSDFERSVWYVYPHTPRAVADIINYRTIIGEEKAVSFDNGPVDIEKFFSGVPVGNESKIVVYHERSYIGKYNPGLAADRSCPELAAWETLKNSHPKNAEAVLSMKVPSDIAGIRKIVSLLNQGWSFIPGVSPHNGRFWLSSKARTNDIAHTVALLYWIQLGLVVNYLRTQCYLAMLPAHAVSLRKYIVGLYSVFQGTGPLSPSGAIVADDWQGMDLDLGEKRPREGN